MAQEKQRGMADKTHSGDMTVREAGHRGGEKVRELIEKGEASMKKGGKQSS